jgi:ribosomal protein L35
MKAKTKKAFAKRIKVTKNGKLLKRHAGQDHFNSRDNGKVTSKKRRDTNMSESYRHSLKSLLPNHTV